MWKANRKDGQAEVERRHLHLPLLEAELRHPYPTYPLEFDRRACLGLLQPHQETALRVERDLPLIPRLSQEAGLRVALVLL